MASGNLHFKLSFQVILMQVVQSPHFEKHRIDEGQQESTSAWRDKILLVGRRPELSFRLYQLRALTLELPI